MGHMTLDEDLILAREQLQTIRMQKGNNPTIERRSLFKKTVSETTFKDGRHTGKVYRFELQGRENYIYAKVLKGTRTNCGLVFFPYDIYDFFDIINSVMGAYPGKLELSSHFNRYLQMENSSSYYGFSVRFSSSLSQNEFIIKYCTAILSDKLSKERLCKSVCTDDTLIQILNNSSNRP